MPASDLYSIGVLYILEAMDERLPQHLTVHELCMLVRFRSKRSSPDNITAPSNLLQAGPLCVESQTTNFITCVLSPRPSGTDTRPVRSCPAHSILSQGSAPS